MHNLSVEKEEYPKLLNLKDGHLVRCPKIGEF